MDKDLERLKRALRFAFESMLDEITEEALANSSEELDFVVARCLDLAAIVLGSRAVELFFQRDNPAAEAAKFTKMHAEYFVRRTMTAADNAVMMLEEEFPSATNATH